MAEEVVSVEQVRGKQVLMIEQVIEEQQVLGYQVLEALR